MTVNRPRPKDDKFYEFKPFVVPKYQIVFKNAGKLSDIPGYVWYTPAILYLWGRYTDINLSDIVQQYDLQIFWYRFDFPVFRGFTANGDPGWNHVLWAAKEEQWPKLVDAILESVQFDIPQKLLYQYALQQFTILDPLTMDRQRIIQVRHPVQLVYGFAALSNVSQVAFDTRNITLQTCPPVVRFKPDSVHVRAAQRLFSRENMTQDQAFARYRELMLRAAHQAYLQKVEKFRSRK